MSLKTEEACNQSLKIIVNGFILSHGTFTLK